MLCILVQGVVDAQAPLQSLPARTTFQGSDAETRGATIGGNQPITPIPAEAGPTSSTILGPTAIDPYSNWPNTGSTIPSLFGAPTPNGTSLAPGATTVPADTAPALTIEGAPALGTNGQDAYPPSSPSSLFPNGLNIPWNGQGTLGQSQFGAPIRLIYGPRLKQTWIYGNEDPRDLQIHDTDVSIALTLPNFVYSGQPIYVLPSFSLHLWDGPKELVSDLPSKAYSAFLDVGWNSDPQQILGLELGGRLGVFSDFNTLTTDSFRTIGKVQGVLQLTPTAKLKAGAVYVDRVRLKLLPIGGVFWKPNSQSKWELSFPKPKIARYMTTIGTHDVWWYLGAEYGGGSWTIERAATATTDHIDINDIRGYLGIEWGPESMLANGRRIGFIEAGWITDREIVYRYMPPNNQQLRDSFMIRAGIGY